MALPICTLCLLFVCKNDFNHDVSLQPRTRGVWGFKILGCSLIKDPSWSLTQASCSGLHFKCSTTGIQQSTLPGTTGAQKAVPLGWNQAGGCAVGCVVRNRYCVQLADVPIAGPYRTQGMWSWKHSQVLPLPQMSREIKMPSPQRQNCAVSRLADLGEISGVESIFRLPELLLVDWLASCQANTFV